MKTITAERMYAVGGCGDGMEIFKQAWPAGAPVDVSVDAFIEGGRIMKADPVWLYRLLPEEGPGSQRAFCLWIAEQVASLHPDVAATILPLARQQVATPGSVDPANARSAQAACAPATRARPVPVPMGLHARRGAVDRPITTPTPSDEAAAHAAHALVCTLAGIGNAGPLTRMFGQAAPLRAAESARKALVLSGMCVDEADAQKVILGKLVELLLAAD